MENITKENRLIAEFMGYSLRECEDGVMEWDYDPWNNPNGAEPTIQEPIIGRTEDRLKFHSEWGWLMPVVQKIEELGATVTIGRMSCDIYFQHPLDRAVNFNNRMVSGVKMNAVHAAIVNFIEFHNAINPSTLN